MDRTITAAERLERMRERRARLDWAEALLAARFGIRREPVHTVPTLAEYQRDEHSRLGLSRDGEDWDTERLASAWLAAHAEPEAEPEPEAEAPQSRAEAVAALEALDAEREAALAAHVAEARALRSRFPRLAALTLGRDTAALWGSVSGSLRSLGSLSDSTYVAGTGEALAAGWAALSASALETDALAAGLSLWTSEHDAQRRARWTHDRLPRRFTFVPAEYPGHVPSRDRRGFTAGHCALCLTGAEHFTCTAGAFSGTVFTYGGQAIREALTGEDSRALRERLPALWGLITSGMLEPEALTASRVARRDAIGRKAGHQTLGGRKAIGPRAMTPAERKAAQRRRRAEAEAEARQLRESALAEAERGAEAERE